jgi:hypothetical protein
VTDDRYVVLDYKTDAVAGTTVDELAATHWPQLRVYAAALAERGDERAEDERAVELWLCFTDVEDADDRVRTRELDVFDLEDCRDDIERSLSELGATEEIHPIR